MNYFDHNATTPLCAAARQAWLEAADQFIGNPSSPHRVGRRAELAMEEARQRLARILGCDPMEIIWTSGATEANNMVLHHAARVLPETAQVWLSAVEHPCVLQSTRHYFPGRHRFIPMTSSGQADLDWLVAELADHRPSLMAVMAANNETGILQPWREILAMCRQYDVPFFCDAVQWIGKRAALGLGDCDFLSGAAHKFGGPKGTGFLKIPRRGTFHSLLLGGPQEDGRRAGTENVAAILSMVAALEHREGQLARGEDKVRLAWRERFEDELLQHLPGSRLVGGRTGRLWNTMSAMMPETDCRVRWVVKMDKAGYAVSTGSACSSGKETPSHVLQALGLSEAESGRVLRCSAGWETAEEEWGHLLAALRGVYHELKQGVV